VIDLRAKEKTSVKQRDYTEAERIKNLANRLESKERMGKNEEIAERIKKRK
jgi:hypothetical protein